MYVSISCSLSLSLSFHSVYFICRIKIYVKQWWKIRFRSAFSLGKFLLLAKVFFFCPQNVHRQRKSAARKRNGQAATKELTRKQKAFHATKLIAASSCCFRSRFCPPKSIILIDVTKNNASDNDKTTTTSTHKTTVKTESHKRNQINACILTYIFGGTKWIPCSTTLYYQL